MKVFVQEKKTGRFLQAPGVWTEDRGRGQIFPGSLQAIDFCHRHGLREVTLIIAFSDPRFDIQVCPFASASAQMPG